MPQPPKRPSPHDIFASWKGVVTNDFVSTIRETFNISDDDDKYTYRAEQFCMTLDQIDQVISRNPLKYTYQSDHAKIEIPAADITAYTDIFSPSTSTSKALTAFASNAKKSSPRETVAKLLLSKRIPPASEIQIPKQKNFVNVYFDVWVHTCHMTGFCGPLPDKAYADPDSAKLTHPVLPVLYHHFGCVVPTWEALCVIKHFAILDHGKEAKGGKKEKESIEEGSIVDLGSGNGYWTYMLRRLSLSTTKLEVTAVDDSSSEYRMMWINDTIKQDGVEYLKKNNGAKGRVLLLVYPVTGGGFTKKVLQQYKGDTVVIAGTQNENRYTAFADQMVEEYFETEMKGWELICRVSLPSFAGKDEGLYVWRRRKG